MAVSHQPRSLLYSFNILLVISIWISFLYSCCVSRSTSRTFHFSFSLSVFTLCFHSQFSFCVFISCFHILFWIFNCAKTVKINGDVLLWMYIVTKSLLIWRFRWRKSQNMTVKSKKYLLIQVDKLPSLTVMMKLVNNG